MKEKTKRTVINEVPALSIVDKNTGEILVNSSESKRIIIEEKTGELEESKVPFNKDAPFVKLYVGKVNDLRKYLTATEFTIAISLSDFVCYEDCILRKGGHHNGKILSMEELANEMDMNYSTLRNTMNGLIKKGIIGIHKTGCKDKPNIIVKAITVNPYVYTKGNNVNETILGLFEHTNWK